MNEAFRSYLLSIVAISLLASILTALVPKGSIHRTLSFLCGLAIILVTIGPIARLDFEDLARSFSQLQLGSEFAATDIQSENDELIASIIKEKSETYIWDKAAAMGLSLTTEVEVKTGDGSAYPYSVSIRGHYSRQQKSQLAREIEADLAIPSERQEWNTDE